MESEVEPLPAEPSPQPTVDLHHRGSVGPADRYDTIGAHQFSVLTQNGLREHHSLLDVGCGSLRAGRLLVMYLAPGNYCGMDPDQPSVEAAREQELGTYITEQKRPTLAFDDDFTLTTFGRKFDFLLAYSIFTHTSQRQMARCFSQAAEVMHPGSAFLGTYLPTEQDYEEDEWVPDPQKMKEWGWDPPPEVRQRYPHWPAVGYRPSTVERIANEAGLHGIELPRAATKLLGPPEGQAYYQTWFKLTLAPASE